MGVLGAWVVSGFAMTFQIDVNSATVVRSGAPTGWLSTSWRRESVQAGARVDDVMAQKAFRPMGGRRVRADYRTTLRPKGLNYHAE